MVSNNQKVNILGVGVGSRSLPLFWGLVLLSFSTPTSWSASPAIWLWEGKLETTFLHVKQPHSDPKLTDNPELVNTQVADDRRQRGGQAGRQGILVQEGVVE